MSSLNGKKLLRYLIIFTFIMLLSYSIYFEIDIFIVSRVLLRIYDKHFTQPSFKRVQGLSLPLDLPPRKHLSYYLHIHKSGGSSVCDLARANLPNTFSRHCNLPLEEAPFYLGNTCDQMYLASWKDGITWLANEGAISCLVPELFNYYTMLRHPHDRAFSDFMHSKHLASYQARQFAISGAPPSSFHEWLELTPDNYLTRMLCGGSAVWTPQLNHSHLLCAQAKLKHFRLVLLVEEMDLSLSMLSLDQDWGHQGLEKNLGTVRHSLFPSKTNTGKNL